MGRDVHPNPHGKRCPSESVEETDIEPVIARLPGRRYSTNLAPILWWTTRVSPTAGFPAHDVRHREKESARRFTQHPSPLPVPVSLLTESVLQLTYHSMASDTALQGEAKSSRSLCSALILSAGRSGADALAAQPNGPWRVSLLSEPPYTLYR